jgi:AcrR family transcriptional regulator
MSAAMTKSEETRERVLEAALEVFRRKGFEKATMREIAAEAGMALGAAYYHYDSKDALAMAFYERAQRGMQPELERVLERPRDLGKRLQAVIEVKFRWFAPDRELLGALSAHIDPRHPLSPFSEETRAIRERDIAFFDQALDGSRERAHADLRAHLPRVLWLYQMGLLLFWVYDHSAGQKRTRLLFDKSLGVVVNLIRFSSMAPLRPVRRLVRELMEIAYGEKE